MKTLKDIITEKLVINSHQQVDEKLVINKDSKLRYSYYPKDKNELRAILEERLVEDKDADLNDIDVSQIKDMYELFKKLDPHNIDISEWDVSNVTEMSGMFWRCKNFNCNLSKWNVKNVNEMEDMFYKCKNFTGDGLNEWKPIKCYNMRYMFDGCDLLKNIPSWYK